MLFVIHYVILLVAGCLGISSCLLARRRIHVLRATGETFAHCDFALSRSAVVISCAVVVVASSAVVANVGVSLGLVGCIIAITGCVYLALIDIDTHLLPWADCIVVGVISCSPLVIDAIIHRQFDVVVTMVISAFLTWVTFRCLEWISRGDLGGGDVVLASVLAGVLGWFGATAVTQALIVAVLSAGVFALVAMLLSRFHLRTAFAFGPFLIVGALFVMMTADPLLANAF